jgi:hypothetical protein
MEGMESTAMHSANWLKRAVLAVAAGALIPGCHLPQIPGALAGQWTVEAPDTHIVPPIVGRVVFPEPRQIQATMADVAALATVTLVDTKTNTSLASSLSNSAGQFNLNFSGSFIPKPDYYYLEASKGYGGPSAFRVQNKSGLDAIRVRTILKFAGGAWQALTAGELVISRATTAASVGIDYLKFTPAEIDVVFGKLAAAAVQGQMNAFDTSGTRFTQAFYTQLFNLTSTALAASRDPVHSIQFDAATGQAFLLEGVAEQPPVITDVNPRKAVAGEQIVVYGRYFKSNPVDNFVYFGGIRGTVVSVEGGRMVAKVPSGALTGNVSVQTTLGEGTFPFEILSTMNGKFLGL